MFTDTNLSLSLSLSFLTESDDKGGMPGCSKNSTISRKFEIRSRVPGIIAVRSEFWIVRLEGELELQEGR